EAIAALDFTRGRAAREHFVKTGSGLIDQIWFARGAGSRHGCNDAASRSGDFAIGRAGESSSEFLPSIASEGSMSVRIDKARNDRNLARVDEPRTGHRRNHSLEVDRRANVDDSAIRRRDGPVLYNVDRSLLGATQRHVPTE